VWSALPRATTPRASPPPRAPSASRARSTFYVPADAPIAKRDAAESQGAIVHVGGAAIEECLDAALARAEEGGLAFVHPYDDADVVAGQGSVGLELLEQVPGMTQVIVPVGGGGLCAGIALAIRDAGVRVVGVRAAASDAGGLTIADGIAVKRPGVLTAPLLDERVDEMVAVEEDEIAEAMVLLMERAKLVVEGAGAVGVAALLSGRVRPGDGATVAVLSGGNVDAGLLAAVARRHETEAGRRLVLLTRVDDRPGSLARMLACVAGTGANVVDVSHVREGLDLHVRETGVELVLETRGREHAREVLAALEAEGYATRTLR
jgi:threonine dehydratase